MIILKSVNASKGSGLLIGFTWALLLVMGSLVTEAEARVTRFSAIDVTCERIYNGITTVDPDTGDVLVEGRIDAGFVLSDNELLAGRSYIIVDSLTEFGSPTTQLWVTPIYYPDAVDGSWIAPGEGEVPPLLVHHFGHGTRDLKYSFIKFKIQGATDVEELPCDPIIPPAELKGVILERRVGLGASNR